MGQNPIHLQTAPHPGFCSPPSHPGRAGAGVADDQATLASGCWVGKECAGSRQPHDSGKLGAQNQVPQRCELCSVSNEAFEFAITEPALWSHAKPDARLSTTCRQDRFQQGKPAPGLQNDGSSSVLVRHFIEAHYPSEFGQVAPPALPRRLNGDAGQTLVLSRIASRRLDDTSLANDELDALDAKHDSLAHHLLGLVTLAKPLDEMQTADAASRPGSDRRDPAFDLSGSRGYDLPFRLQGGFGVEE